jgi:hypothetical protein
MSIPTGEICRAALRFPIEGNHLLKGSSRPLATAATWLTNLFSKK